MANILDYLIWRGDLSFKNSRLNEIDKIIFTRFSYLPFKEIEMAEKETIESLMNKFENVDSSKFIWLDDVRLIRMMGTSVRFKDLIITDYEEMLDKSLEKQFAAVTIWISETEKYISFRGTDTSIVGWKEDFNMSFKSNIPSQIEGISYLNRVGKKYSNSDLFVGGHSKGGNISIYASTFCDDIVKLNIKEIISADGPGLTKEVINDIRYKEIESKVKTYLPQMSIVGRILECRNDYSVIQSNEKGFMQHDVYSWEVGPTFFIQIKDVTKESNFANELIKEWLEKTTPEDREKFINIIYEILVSSDIDSFHDLPKLVITNTNKVLKTYKNISEEDKLQLENMMNQIKKLISDIIKNELISQNIIKEKERETLKLNSKSKEKKELKKKEHKKNNKDKKENK